MDRADTPSPRPLSRGSRWPIAILLVAGCSTIRAERRDAFVHRTTPSPAIEGTSEGRAGSAPAIWSEAATDPAVRPASASQPEETKVEALPFAPESSAERARPRPPGPSVPEGPIVSEADVVAGRPVPLPEAIALAFRHQPRLRVYLETIEQARGQSGIAFAPFLPTLGTGYSVGGFNLNVGGKPLRAPSSPNFTVLPPGFALPVGLHLSTGYELAEMRLQYLICDFGRRLGAYQASRLAVDIAQLQTERAFQTVANEVAVAYYNALRARALRRTARAAVRRAEDELEVARKLVATGSVQREQVLQAQMELAETQRQLDSTEEAVAVAAAALNLAIGLKCGEPIEPLEPPGSPACNPSLGDALQTAVNERREFRVARRSIEVAQEGLRVANATFAPRIISEGTLIDLQQSAPRGHADVALGFIKLEWILFEGGRRLAERRVSDSRLREAMASAESIADNVTFQVNEAYRRLVTARLGIERARPAVEQATENYRLVRARALQGDATPSDIITAQALLTRAQENYLNSTYDYLTAVARMEYATGITPTPETLARRLP